MISVTEALAKILKDVAPLPARTLPLADGLNRYAARDVFARLPMPLFDNSAMDGYAVVARSASPGNVLKVAGEQPAGADRALRVSAGEAIRIFTGAPIPAGADAVIMQEDVDASGSEITCQDAVEAGQYIRRRGCDLAVGQKILETGQRIRPETLALLASQGLSEIQVGGEVRCSVVSTGDELVTSRRELLPGELYESNSVLLVGLLKNWGATVVSSVHCGDELEAIKAALNNGSENDALILSGGVSVGAHDLVKSALSSLGARIDLWRVAVKPGKPFLFGHLGDTRIFGLPGNPVSAFVTFLLFVRPAILKLMGAGDSELALAKVPSRLGADIHNDGDRAHYVRGKIENGVFTPVGRQESHALYSLARSNALLLVGCGEKIAAGAPVEAIVWG